MGRGLRGSTRPQHIGAPPSPAAPSLIKEGRKEGRVTGSISGLWKAWQGSSRKPGNLEGNSHSPPLPILGTPPPSPRDANPPNPPWGSIQNQACPVGSRHILRAHRPVGTSHLARWRSLPASGGQPDVSRVPRGTRGPGVTAHGAGTAASFHATRPQRGPSVGSARTRTRLPWGRSRKRGKSVHPGGRSERLLARAGPDDSVVSAPSACGQRMEGLRSGSESV